jgi:hypothetical protein
MSLKIEKIILDRPVSNLEELNTDSWLPAMYWIRATDAGGLTRTFKVLKF